MKAKLILENGKTIDMELTESLVNLSKQIASTLNELDEAMDNLKNVTLNKKTGYERVKNCDTYYSSNNGDLSECDGNIYTEDDINDYVDNSRYDNAEYYNDKTLAKNIARADTLMRRLRRFAVENGGSFSREEWANDDILKYYMVFNYDDNRIEADWIQDYKHLEVYFRSGEIAQKAIDTFKEDLMWYFTEFDDMLR